MGLLGYLKPKDKNGQAPVEKKVENGEEMMESKPETSQSSISGTPGNQTPGSWSRPASIYPNDYRQSQSEDINEIKADVMVNWLYQQQMERLWTAGGADEGVVLKKSRGQYTCCPADILEEPYGLYKAIETLNVRVSLRIV